MARLRRDRVAIRVDERDRRGGDVEDDLPLTHDRRADDGAAALVVEDGDAVVARFGAVRVEEAARLLAHAKDKGRTRVRGNAWA